MPIFRNLCVVVRNRLVRRGAVYARGYHASAGFLLRLDGDFPDEPVAPTQCAQAIDGQRKSVRRDFETAFARVMKRVKKSAPKARDRK